MNLKKMVNRFEGPALTDAFSRGQLQSKLWLLDKVSDYNLKLGDTIYVCAGWYGVLSALLFERYNVEGNIYSFDSDPTTSNPADTLNKEWIIDNMKFKSFVKDIKELKYDDEILPIQHFKYTDATEFEIMDTTHEIKKPTCVINTSCEHITDFKKWWDSIPKGTMVILQNNDFVDNDDETVVNTITDMQSWLDELKLSKEIFSGVLSLEQYKRYMVIGTK